MNIKLKRSGWVQCHLLKHRKSTLLTTLPWLHTYDIILGEAVLQQPHPEEWTTFKHTQPEQEITNNSDILLQAAW